ncbi:hypothetical protein R3P38DRAFT_3001048 [Favolaschia claudopus]|uniref:Uncharacterized protein n=1 Tax=Favolaschia claudopus TaxID=2862362 RepID=A0AAW0APU9_9AGAR
MESNSSPRSIEESQRDMERILLETVPWSARKKGGTELQQCLKRLWAIAFDKGMECAEEDAEQVRKEGYEEGDRAGTQRAVESWEKLTVAIAAKQVKQLEGERMWGFEVGWKLCEKKMKKNKVRDVSSTGTAVQTDMPVPALVSVAVFAPSLPLSNIATQTDIPTVVTIVSTPLDWAEDAQELPTRAPPPPTPVRDFSCLRSDRTHPFASLRRRERRAPPSIFYHTRAHRHCRPPKIHSQYISHPRSYSHSYPQYPPTTFFHSTRQRPRLDWDHDPRLRDLSRALTALGWCRPH